MVVVIGKMPEPIPTTDVASEVKDKKIPKWALIGIVGGGVLVLLWYKHKKAKEEESKGSLVEAQTGGQNTEAVTPTSSGGSLINAAQGIERENTSFLEGAIGNEQEKKEASKEPISRNRNQNTGEPRGNTGKRGTEVTGTKGSTEAELPKEIENPRGPKIGPVKQEPVKPPTFTLKSLMPLVDRAKIR